MPKQPFRAKSASRRTNSFRRAGEPVEQLEQRRMMARLTGIDVSHFQGTMNWTTAVNQGIKFAFIRGSRTDTLPDTQLANNMNGTTGAKAKGLVVGVYHRILPFSNTSDNGAFVDPLVDAQNFHNAAGSYMGTGYMRPVIDVENGASLNTTPVNGYTLSSWVVAWVNRLKQLNGNITPLIYTGHYRSNLNSTVQAALPDLWIANWETATYGNPVTGSGGPPTSPWNPSPNWKFWQYDSPNGLGSTYGAQSTDIDLDVFNGNDIDALKQFVTGAPAIPTGPSPSNGATNVAPTNVLLNWNDAAGATRYDVYLDNMTTPIATNVAVSQYTVASVTGGVHTWKIVAKGVSNDDDTFVDSSGVDGSGNPTHWSFTATSLPLPGAPASPSPANGAIVNTKPMTLDWADSSNAASYQVWSGATLVGTSSTSQFGPISPLDGLRPWHVVAINATGSTTGPAWSFTMDTVAPTASYGNQSPTEEATYLDFTVTYTDTNGVDASSFDSGDVRVTGPGGFDAPVVFQSVNTPGNGTPRTVTYRVAAPGGTWNGADNGTYNIVQQATEVKDVAGTGNYRAAGNIGSFNVDFATFAWMTGSTLNVQFDGTSTPIMLEPDLGGNIEATRDGNSISFGGVTTINVLGTALDDTLQINGAIAPPLTFSNGTGNDTVHVVGGSYTFANDLSPSARNVAVTVDAGATATFDSSQHLRNLSVAGTAVLSQGGAKVLVTNGLSLTGRLDLKDNDFVLDYIANDPSPLGTWDSGPGAYDGVLGLIVSGRNGGDYLGNGLVTSESDAAASLTYLGAARAGDLYGIGDSDTTTFGNETVDGSSIVVKYTWSADSDLNGELNGDDYFNIDANVGQSGFLFGQTVGDFDLNGEMNGDDYFMLDSIILQAQGSGIIL